MTQLTDIRRYRDGAVNFRDDPMVVIHTKDDGGKFHLQSKIATSSSGYIKRILDEGPALVVDVPIRGHYFNIYVNWLYTGLLCTKVCKDIAGQSEDTLLAEIYVLSLCLEDKVFTSLIAEAFLTKMRGCSSKTRVPSSAAISDDIGPKFHVAGHERLVVLIAEAYARHASGEEIEQLKNKQIREKF